MYHEPDGAVLFLFKDEKREEVFLIFRTDYTVWWFLGGAIEGKELPEDTALREAEEETGFKVKLIRRLGISERVDKKGKILNTIYYFEGRKLSGEYTPEYPGNIGQWFKVNKLPFSIPSITKKTVEYAANFKGEEFHYQTTKKNLSSNLLVYLIRPKLLRKYLKDLF